MSEVELPTTIPVFPLPNVVLFPDVMLPLHIFEPRYRQMIQETREKTPPLIGLALLRGNWQEQYEGRPEVFPVCCAGEMVRVSPMPDGRFNVLLRGVQECHLKEELSGTGKLYREFAVEWRQPDPQLLALSLRRELDGLLEAYLKKNETVQKFLSDPTVEDGFFVNFFSFHLDLLPIEKQSLLEAVSLPERATRLRDTLDFKLTEGHWTDGGSANKSRLH